MICNKFNKSSANKGQLIVNHYRNLTPNIVNCISENEICQMDEICDENIVCAHKRKLECAFPDEILPTNEILNSSIPLLWNISEVDTVPAWVAVYEEELKKNQQMEIDVEIPTYTISFDEYLATNFFEAIAPILISEENIESI